MATVQIPVTKDPNSEVTVNLSGVNYTLRFRWNTRSEAFYMDVLDEDGDILAAGRKVIVGWLCGAR